MGSYNEIITGKGKNRQDALRNAWDEYVYENGHRCSLRIGEASIARSKKLRDAPPMKTKVTKKLYVGLYGRHDTVDVISAVEDPSAPKQEWLEEWEFEVWVHS